MKRGRVIFLVAMLVALLGAAGCASKTANDQQVAQAVQGKIYADSGITSRQITAVAASGVVTLNGTVATEAERQAAAGDAAQVGGVKTVVNNLVVAAAPSPAASAPAPAAAPPSRRRVKRSVRSSRAAENAPARPAPAVPPPAAKPPAAPAVVTVPAGTEVAIRMIDSIDSNQNKPGDVFRASLDSPIVARGRVIVPKGADVQGKIVALKTSGKFTGSTSIALELTRIRVAGRSYDISTDQYSAESSSRGKRTAETVGGGAAVGAVIGAIAGKGKGAAIGAAAGAGTGAAVQALTKPQQVKVPSETRVVFHLAAPVGVIPPG